MNRARTYRTQPLKNVAYVAKEVAPQLVEKEATEKTNWWRDKLRSAKKLFGR
jgi:hypothetical protein